MLWPDKGKGFSQLLQNDPRMKLSYFFKKKSPTEKEAFIELLMGHEVQFGTIGLAPTTHSVFLHMHPPTACLWHSYPSLNQHLISR